MNHQHAVINSLVETAHSSDHSEVASTSLAQLLNFAQSDLMPHGHCYLWQPALVWTHVISDFLIGSAYVAISLALYFIVRRIRIQFSMVVLSFGIFIGACGATHYLEIWNLWNAHYWLAGWVKALTALASVTTAIYLIRLKPQILAVAEAARLSQKRQLDLEALTKSLEMRVEERTQEVHKMERKFRSTFDQAAIGMAHVGLDGKWLLVNRRFCEITGYQEDELLQMSFADITHPEDIQTDWKQAHSLAAGQILSYEMEKRYLRKDGTIVWVKLSVTLNSSESGVAEYYIACVDDISAEKEARLQTELEGAKIRNLFNQVPTPIAIYDGPEHRISLANPYFRQQTGREQLIGLTYEEAFPLARDQGIVDILGAVYRRGETWNVSEFFVRLDKPGTGIEEKYINATLQPYRDLNGHVAGLINLSYDVTEQVLARQRLEESQKRLDMALKTANMGIWEWNLENHTVHWDEKTRELFGVNDERFAVHPLDESLAQIHPDDRDWVHERALEAVARGREFREEFRTPERDGKVHWILCHGGAIYNEMGKPVRFSGVATDISERKQVEAAVRTAKDAAETANQAKTQFLANISHEIRTPLGAMLGFAQLMLEDEQSSELQRKSLQTIVRNGEQLYRIINELLDISKVEANKFETEKAAFDLEEAVRDVTSLLSVKADQKGIGLNVQSEGMLPQIVWTDPVRFRQILINVIGNAIKFTERGRVDVSFRLLPPRDESDGSSCLEVKVQDTGVGIPADKIEKLFQPFTQADNATTRRFGGTGLGLYLSRKFAQALGGDIQLSNCEENHGCLFTILISVGSVKSSPLFNFKAQKSDYQIKGPLKNITLENLHHVEVLVVDDSEDNLELTKRFLTAAGAQVTLALGALKALDILNEKSFDVVVMDIQMPEIDGYEAVKQLRQRGYRKPVVALTAHAMKGERERCMQAGFDGFLNKPINRAALVSEIKRQAHSSSSIESPGRPSS